MLNTGFEEEKGRDHIFYFYKNKGKIEERLLPDRGYFRARMVLSNTDFLEAAEYFVLEEGRGKTKRYRYQWLAAGLDYSAMFAKV